MGNVWRMDKGLSSRSNEMMNTLYVDVDGTLLDGSLDREFKERSYDVAWYNGVYKEDQVVNWELIAWLKRMKERGWRVVIWTNRGECQVGMTKKNLSCMIGVADEWVFGEGKKREVCDVSDGMVVDNEDINLIGARNIKHEFMV